MGMNRTQIDDKYKWDLSSLYKSEASLNQDFDKVSSLLKDIEGYKGKLSSSEDNFKRAMNMYEEILRLSENIYVYTHMKSHEDTRDNNAQAFAGKAEMLSTNISTVTSFIVPEILEFESDKLNVFLKDKEINHYKNFIEEIMRRKPHTLSLREEEILAMSGDVANNAETTFEMLTFADLTFPEIENEKGEMERISHGNFSKFLQSKNKRVRETAFKAVYDTYGRYKNTFAATFSGSVKREVFYSRCRKYETALQGALFDDDIKVSVYDNLIKVINNNLPELNEFLDIKKEFLKLDSLHMYDLYAPITSDFEFKISFEEGRDIILKALKPLGSEYIDIVKKSL